MSNQTAVPFRLGSSLSVSHYGLFRLAPATLLLALCGGTSFSQQPPTPTSAASVVAEYGKLPLTFEPNQGQDDPRVRFSSRGQGYSLFLTDSAAVLSLSKSEAQNQRSGGRQLEPRSIAPQTTPIKTDVVRMELAGAAPGLRVAGTDPLSGKVNYFIGKDPSKWRSDVPTYSKVKYSAVYPGIDLVYYGNQRQLEYDFIVAPDADASQVRLHFAGAGKLSIDSKGDLKISAANGEISFHKPVVYQMKNGQREPVAGKFQLLAKSDVGFALGDYDRNRELVIDPTLAYSTYLGGSTSESATGIAVDGTGHAYVTGGTLSSDFPVLAGGYQTVDPGSAHPTSVAFVTKFHHDGSGLIYSTFLGGSGSDSATAIALDSKGDAYLTGTTFSTDFPVTAGAYETSPGNSQNSFVTELNPTGSNLIYSTYLLNTSYPGATGIAVDPSYHAYVAGFTNYKDFPVSADAFQKTNRSKYGSGFVVKLTEAGSSAIYSTYLGGSNYEYAYGIAVGKQGEAYITGTTYSHDFPETAGAYQTKNKAAGHQTNNAFVTKLNTTGSALVYSTYLGGSGAPDGVYVGDTGYGIAIDAAGDAYVTGSAFSDDFPHTNGAYQTVNHAESTQSGNAFVAKFNPAGSQLLYSTYLGGSGIVNVAPINDSDPVGWGDSGSAIAVDSIGDAYVTGYAVSGDFPVTIGAYMTQDPSEGGNEDGNNPVAFFSKLNPAGSQLLYSTYMGGLGCGTGIGAGYDGTGDLGNAIAVDPTGNVYLAGETCSGNFPTSSNAFDPTNKASFYGGFTTGFVSKFQFPDATKLSLVSSENPAQFGANVTFTAQVKPSVGSDACTGSVFFDVNSMDSATVALDATGQASYSIDSLTAGEQAVVAQYFGDYNCVASSATLTETIVSTTTTSLSSSNPDAKLGKPVTFTAIVSANDSRDATTGTVTFKNGSATIGTATLQAGLSGTHTVGIATLTTTSLPLGTLKITAVYGGSTAFDPSTSPVLTEVVSN